MNLSRKKLQYLITTNEEEIKPDVKAWLDSQNNRSQSVLFLIEQIVKIYGTGDLVDQVLGEADITGRLMKPNETEE